VFRGPLFPACRLHYPGETLRAPSGSSPERNGLPRNKGGSALASSLSRPARSSLRAATRRVAEPDYSDSSPEGFMVTRYQATMPPWLPRRPDNSSGGILPRKRTRAFHGAPHSALVSILVNQSRPPGNGCGRTMSAPPYFGRWRVARLWLLLGGRRGQQHDRSGAGRPRRVEAARSDSAGQPWMWLRYCCGGGA
jgi:hypothetical protein